MSFYALSVGVLAFALGFAVGTWMSYFWVRRANAAVLESRRLVEQSFEVARDAQQIAQDAIAKAEELVARLPIRT